MCTFRTFLLVMAGGTLAGCASSTRPAPALSSPMETGPAYVAPKKDVLKEAGDVTWRVVTAPAQMLPKKAPPRGAPETFEAPSAVIIRRNYDEAPELPAEAGPAPATQPSQ